MLFDLQVSTDASYGRMNELVGTRNDLVSQYAAPAVTQALVTAGTAAATNYLPAYQVNSGEGFHFAANATVSDGTVGSITTTATSPRYYCLNLISLLGSLNSGNYFPLFACTSSPLRMEIQLVANVYNAGMAINAGLTPSITNVEYIANFIKLSDSAMSIIYGSISPNEPLQFCVPDYSNYQYNFALATGSTQVNFPNCSKV
jgi:hypothetical protein